MPKSKGIPRRDLFYPLFGKGIVVGSIFLKMFTFICNSAASQSLHSPFYPSFCPTYHRHHHAWMCYWLFICTIMCHHLCSHTHTCTKKKSPLLLPLHAARPLFSSLLSELLLKASRRRGLFWGPHRASSSSCAASGFWLLL